MKTIIFSLLAALSMGACKTAPERPTDTQIESAVTDAMPADYEAQIRDYWKHRLIDPTSPLFTLDAPKKGYSTRLGDQVVYGWNVDYRLNSKNRYGGYTGDKWYSAFFKHGRLMLMYERDYFGGWRPIQ